MGARPADAVRRAGVVALIAELGALVAALPGPAHAAPGDLPTVQVVPAGVAPAPGDIVQVAVVLDNPTDSPVAFRGLRFITPPRMTVAIRPTCPVSCPQVPRTWRWWTSRSHREPVRLMSESSPSSPAQRAGRSGR